MNASIWYARCLTLFTLDYYPWLRGACPLYIDGLVQGCSNIAYALELLQFRTNPLISTICTLCKVRTRFSFVLFMYSWAEWKQPLRQMIMNTDKIMSAFRNTMRLKLMHYLCRSRLVVGEVGNLSIKSLLKWSIQDEFRGIFAIKILLADIREISGSARKHVLMSSACKIIHKGMSSLGWYHINSLMPSDAYMRQ